MLTCASQNAKSGTNALFTVEYRQLSKTNEQRDCQVKIGTEFKDSGGAQFLSFRVL